MKSKNTTSIPAKVVTGVTIQMTPSGCRISFGESDGSAITFHTSLYLPVDFIGKFEQTYKEAMDGYLKQQQAKTEIPKPKRKNQCKT